jgi:hypothetical protein
MTFIVMPLNITKFSLMALFKNNYSKNGQLSISIMPTGWYVVLLNVVMVSVLAPEMVVGLKSLDDNEH